MPICILFVTIQPHLHPKSKSKFNAPALPTISIATASCCLLLLLRPSSTPGKILGSKRTTPSVVLIVITHTPARRPPSVIDSTRDFCPTRQPTPTGPCARRFRYVSASPNATAAYPSHSLIASPILLPTAADSYRCASTDLIPLNHSHGSPSCFCPRHGPQRQVRLRRHT